MSTSSTTSSGITFVFTPPWTMFGEIVMWVQAWANLATRSSGTAASASSIVAGSTQRSLELRREVERADVGAVDVVEHGRRAVGGQAADHLGRGHEGVVGAVGHRAVAGRAMDGRAGATTTPFSPTRQHDLAAVLRPSVPQPPFSVTT